MARVLAIDYGKKRSGLAVTDAEQIIASGLAAMNTEELMDFLKDYLQKESVETIVVGMPVNLDGEDTHATQLCRDLVKKLQKTFPAVEIAIADESFTSRMAVQTMVHAGIRKKKRRDKHMVDKISAVLILQGWMEENH